MWRPPSWLCVREMRGLSRDDGGGLLVQDEGLVSVVYDETCVHDGRALRRGIAAGGVPAVDAVSTVAVEGESGEGPSSAALSGAAAGEGHLALAAPSGEAVGHRG